MSYFHTVNPGLSSCFAHDMFEGIIQKDLMLILNKFNKLNFIFFESLNLKIKTLWFTNESQLYFTELKKDESETSWNSYQNLWLLLILPFAFVDDVNNEKKDNDLWEMMLCAKNYAYFIRF